MLSASGGAAGKSLQPARADNRVIGGCHSHDSHRYPASRNTRRSFVEASVSLARQSTSGRLLYECDPRSWTQIRYNDFSRTGTRLLWRYETGTDYGRTHAGTAGVRQGALRLLTPPLAGHGPGGRSSRRTIDAFAMIWPGVGDGRAQGGATPPFSGLRTVAGALPARAMLTAD